MKKLGPVSLFLLLGALPLAALQAPATRPAPKPAPSPTPAPALEGTVKGPDGKPIEGALVFARPPWGFGTPDPVSTRTSADGRFRLTLKRAVAHTLRADAPGFAGRTVEKAIPGTPVELRLSKGVALEGIVRDGTTGQPVPQARVEAGDEMAPSLPWEATAGLSEAVTDVKGHFRIEGLSNAPQSVKAQAKGYGAGRRSGAVPGRPVDVYLFPGSTLSGTVWGPGNVRLVGAVVRAERDTPTFRAQMRPVLTDTQGRYEIAGLDPGNYRVSARHKDYAAGVASGVVVERGGDAEVDVVLDKGAVVVGRLVSGDEPRPVSGRVVVQEIDGQRAPEAMRELLNADAGDDGRFRLESVPAGAHALGVTARGYASKRVEVQVSPKAREVSLGDVEVESGLTIRGRVRDRAGLPVAGATVTGQPARRMAVRFVETVSEADGTYVLGGLDAGIQRLSTNASGYAPVQHEAEAGAEKIDFVLSPAGSISGTVVDEAARPVEIFNVSARPAKREQQDGIVIETPRFRNVSATDGRFLIEDVGEGTYVVEATAPERASAHVSDIKVVAGGTTDAGIIRVTAGGTIRGTVVDASSAPVPGASVRVRGPGMDAMMFQGGVPAVTDPTGAFEIKGIPVGTVELSATHPNYATGRAGGIEVDPAKGAADARIVLLQGARIDGFVGRRDGTPIAAAYVSVTPQRVGGGAMMGGEGPGMLVTNADGAFTAEHLPAGRASVTLMARSGLGFMSSQFREVDLRDGEATRVEIRSREILVSGRVTRSGAPVPGARVSLRGNRMMMMMFGGMSDDVAANPAGPQRMTGVTGEDGSYELIADEPGRTNVVVESTDGRVTFPWRTAELPDADAFTLDLAYTVSTVTGIVIDRETDKPVARARVFAARKNPQPGTPRSASSALGGEDGRFQLELDPGDYRVSASADGYSPAELDTTVGSGGNELRLAMSRGLTLVGRVVDTHGRAVGGLMVFASSDEAPPGVGMNPNIGGYATTLPDGSFQMSGLKQAPYRLVAQSELGAFATRSGVSPGEKDVVLTLRPGGRVSVRVLGPDGQPVAGAFAGADGVGMSVTSDVQGVAEMMVPAGTSQIRVRKDQLEARVTVTVTEGGTAATEVQLTPAPAAGTH